MASAPRWTRRVDADGVRILTRPGLHRVARLLLGAIGVAVVAAAAPAKSAPTLPPAEPMNRRLAARRRAAPAPAAENGLPSLATR